MDKPKGVRTKLNTDGIRYFEHKGKRYFKVENYIDDYIWLTIRQVHNLGGDIGHLEGTDYYMERIGF